MSPWKECKKILCIRADNMGDVLMMTPALKALKQTIKAELTVLTSSQGKPVCDFIPEIDDTIIADLPWVKLNSQFSAGQYEQLIAKIRSSNFDAAIIFTVYSQSALPAALLAFQAGIPRRLAYSRENPYHLLTDWVPDEEPFSIIRHQVERDLQLVASIGATTSNDRLSFQVTAAMMMATEQKLAFAGVYLPEPYIILHTGVSEEKREYPAELWMQLIRELSVTTGSTIVLTGSAGEKEKVNKLLRNPLPEVYNVAGLLDVGELGALIKRAAVVISVNTAIIHIAAALNTPVIVLYAMTNPQHTPWRVPSQVLRYSVPDALKSRNEVIRYVDRKLYNSHVDFPTPERIIEAITNLSSDSRVTSGSPAASTT
jgi:lipopolysaccharide heptosyltransferase II